jgi:hypothetical protein
VLFGGGVSLCLKPASREGIDEPSLLRVPRRAAPWRNHILMKII